jgi:hypothetical protein
MRTIRNAGGERIPKRRHQLYQTLIASIETGDLVRLQEGELSWRMVMDQGASAYSVS